MQWIAPCFLPMKNLTSLNCGLTIRPTQDQYTGFNLLLSSHVSVLLFPFSQIYIMNYRLEQYSKHQESCQHSRNCQQVKVLMTRNRSSTCESNHYSALQSVQSGPGAQCSALKRPGYEGNKKGNMKFTFHLSSRVVVKNEWRCYVHCTLHLVCHESFILYTECRNCA